MKKSSGIKRNAFFALALALLMCCGVLLTVTVRAEDTPTDTGGKITYSDGTISFYKDFAALPQYDMTWQTDEAVTAYDGDLTIGASTPKALGPGKQNSSSAGSGSVSYLVDVPEGNVINTLSWTSHGRFFHSTSNTECNAGECACDYAVSLSTDNGANFTKVSTESITTNGTNGVTFTYDVSALAAGQKSVIFKLSMTGKSWNWVHMTDVAIDGTYGERKVSVADDFTNNDVASPVFSKSNVVDSGGAHGLLPAAVWGGSVATGTGGYIVYKVDAPEGTAFTSMTLDFNAKVWHMSNEDYASNNIKVYASASADNFGEALYTQLPSTSPTNNVACDNNVVLTSVAENLKTVYVKIELNHAVGSLHDADGLIGLSYVGTKLFSVSIEGKYAEVVSNTGNFTLSESFDVGGLTPGSSAATATNLSGGNGSHGIVPAPAWGDPVNAGTGSLVYKLSLPEGGKFETLSLAVNARISYTNNQADYEVNNVKIYASDDGADFGTALYTQTAVAAYPAATYNFDLDAVAAGKEEIYVKIELNHFETSVSLTYLGVKLFGVDFDGTYDKSGIIEATDFSKTFTFAAGTLDDVESYHSAKEVSISGVNHFMAEGLGGYIVLKLEAPGYDGFHSLKLALTARNTVYGMEPFNDSITVFVSGNGTDYTKVTSFNTDVGWVQKVWNADLSEAAKGLGTAYVKLQIAFPENWASSTDWVAMSAAAFTGSTVARTEFGISYMNMENASYEGGTNPATYTAGTPVTLLDPVRANYTFGGWYTDSELTQAFAGITAETVGDLVLYADWQPVSYTITLNAGEGVFAGGGSTHDITAYYSGTIAKTALPANPVKTDYDFIGWYADEALTTPWVFEGDLGQATVVDGSVLTLYAKYDNAVTVTYDYNDGATAEYVAAYAIGDKAQAPAEPTRTGYSFGGWMLDDALFNFDTALSESITLTAQWYEIFTVTYTGVEGTVSNNNRTSYIETDGIITLNAPVKTGYNFTGWTLEGAECTQIDAAAGLGDITLNATWTVKEYALSVVAGAGGTVTPASDTTIPYTGKEFTVTANAGYRIGSVTVNAGVVHPDTEGKFTVSGIDGDVTVNASFVAQYSYTGGFAYKYAETADWQNYVYDMYNMKLVGTGTSHLGWLAMDSVPGSGYIVYELSAGEGKTFNTMYLDGKARVFIFEGSQSVFKVYVSKDGGEFVEAAALASTANGSAYSNIDQSLTALVKGASKVRIKIELTMVAGNSGSYDDWLCLENINVESSLTTVTVSFRDVSGTVIGTNTDQILGGVFVPYSPEPVKNGYSFGGWYLEDTLTTAVPANYTVTAAMSVYAKWNAVTYDITYHNVDEDDNGDNPETYKTTDTFTLGDPERVGKKFLGWYGAADFSGEKLTNVTGMYGNLNLYAKWQDSAAIIYNLNGGTNNAENPSSYFPGESVTLSDPTRSGYIFDGWYSDADFTDLVTEIEDTETGEVELFAKWVPSGSGGDNTGGDDEGCKNSLGAGSIVLCAALAGCAAVIAARGKKKKVE